MGLPVIRLSKVLELHLQQNQGWLERVWCCCWTFSELEVGSSLQLFWYFPRNWQTLLLQQPPAFWERSLQAGNNCCLSKAVLLCFIIPHLAFLMKVLVRGVLRCKDVHKAVSLSVPAVVSCPSLGCVFLVLRWDLQALALWNWGLFDFLPCSTTWDYKQTCRETGPVILCSWKLLCCAERHSGHQLLRKGGCYSELQPGAPDGGFISCWSNHFHPLSSSWAAWRAVLGRHRGQLAGSCCPQGLWEHRCTVTVLQGWGWGQPAPLHEKTNQWSTEEILQGFLPVWETQFKYWAFSLACFPPLSFGVYSAGWCWFVWQPVPSPAMG